MEQATLERIRTDVIVVHVDIERVVPQAPREERCAHYVRFPGQYRQHIAVSRVRAIEYSRSLRLFHIKLGRGSAIDRNLIYVPPCGSVVSISFPEDPNFLVVVAFSTPTINAQKSCKSAQKSLY